MELTLERRQRPKPGVALSVMERLKSRFSGDVDRGRRPAQVPRPYSFRTACQCPDDCLRDHENE